MLYRTPSDWYHTATALPDGSTATCGYQATPASSVSRSAAVPQPMPGTKRLAQMLNWTPSSWYHTATALPDESTATCGRPAPPALSVSRSAAVPQPTPGTKRFAQMLSRTPANCHQTPTALPDA